LGKTQVELVAPSDAVNFSCGVQVPLMPPARVNTMPAPLPPLLPGLPTTAVSPEMPTENPKSPPEPSSAGRESTAGCGCQLPGLPVRI